MSEANFEDVLSMTASDVKPPPTLPRGVYRLAVAEGKQAYEFGKQNNENKTPFCQIHYNVVAPHKVEDESQLDGVEVTKKKLSNKFWTTPEAISMLTEHMKNDLGMEFEEGETILQALQRIGGLEVFAMVELEKAKQTNREYNIIKSFMSLKAAAATEVE